ncbi:Protein disulfide isomerase-like 1-1, variant 2 [Salvia divinorum]|uniref:Protein disulfide isomerase-like 1-1, variant 2 n=1 Tax=Salvia divinorum TaxID=28513 RepID=A0ABD1HQV1_SALDI
MPSPSFVTDYWNPSRLPYSAASVTAEESESKEFVVALDYSNLTDFDAKHKFVVVEFYVPPSNVVPLLWELRPVYRIRSIRASAKSLEKEKEKKLYPKVANPNSTNSLAKIASENFLPLG